MAGNCGSTCPVKGGFYTYNPNLGGNAVLLAAFALLVPAVFYLGFRFRTPLFSTTVATGLLFAILGFLGRVLLNSSSESQGLFFLSLLGTTIGPVCFSGAIFLTLPHILSVYGDHLSPFQPMLAGVILCGLAVAAAVLQTVGVAFTAYDLAGIGRDGGTKAVAAGLGIQLLALVAFSALHLWFTLEVKTRIAGLDAKHAVVYRSKRFERFLLAMQIASILLVIYSAYRIVEMSGRVVGTLFQNEVVFMILDGVVPLLAAVVITLQNPGAAFGSAWGPTSPLRVKKRRSAPPPPLTARRLPPDYPIHERYDPSIRGQITPKTSSPMSQSHKRHYSNPPELPEGSPGLPINPKPIHKSPMPSPTGTSGTVETIVTSNIRRERRNDVPPKKLVERDMLW